MTPARCSHTTAAVWKVLWQHMSPFFTMQTGLFALTFANWDSIRAAGALTLCYRQVFTVPPNNLFKISCAICCICCMTNPITMFAENGGNRSMISFPSW